MTLHPRKRAFGRGAVQVPILGQGTSRKVTPDAADAADAADVAAIEAAFPRGRARELPTL